MVQAVRILALALLDAGVPDLFPLDPTPADPAPPNVPADALRRHAAAIVVRLWLADRARDLQADPRALLFDIPLPPPAALARAREALRAELPDTPDALGEAYQHLLTFRAHLAPDAPDPADRFTLTPTRASARRARGAFYTPVFLVEHLVRACLDPVLDRGTDEAAVLRVRVCDPACGSGRFLVEAATRLGDHLAQIRHGPHPAADDARRARAEVIAQCLHGMDLDPTAVDVCRATLWAHAGGACGGALRVVTGDALGQRWPWEGFDAVVGNPPFLNGLRRETAMGPGRSERFAGVWGHRVGAYTDASACFLLASVSSVREGGRVGLVQPMSVLAAQDAGPVRRAVLERACVRSLWVSGEDRVFAGTSVRACAVVLEAGAPRRGAVARTIGEACAPRPSVRIDADALREAPTWTPLTAGMLGVPEVIVRCAGTLRDIAAATADFRDEYYALAGCLVESASLGGTIDESAYPRVLTSGLIDPAVCLWGRARCRIGGRVWEAPRADRKVLGRDARMAAWAGARLVPKVLVAMQTRVIEACVDEAGVWLPCTPVVTVTPREGGEVWRVAAAVSSPVVAAWALGTYGGAALALGAIKVSARQVMAAPLPTDARAWAAGAEAFGRASGEAEEGPRLASLREYGGLMARAYGLGAAEAEGVLGWWSGRLGVRGAGRPKKGLAAAVGCATM